MNFKKAFFPILTCGVVIGLSAGVLLLKNGQPITAARAETSPYAITANDYEVAMLESQSHHDHPFDHSKYLLGDYLNGNGEGKNVTLDLKMGIEETPFQWRFNLVRGYLKSGTTRYNTVLRASNSSNTYNICDTTQYTETDNPDEYAIGQLLAGKTMTYGGAMISNDYFNQINDISFYWRYTEAKRIYVCYQIEGDVWKILDGTSSINGNYTGTRGWDSYGYTTFNSSSWKTKELYGAKAKLALVVAGTAACDVQLGGVVINASNAAVRYLNALTYHDNICNSDSDITLKKGIDDSVSNQYVFQLATERADAATLQEYLVVGSKTQAYTALDLYNHLVSSIPALGEVKVYSSNIFTIVNKNNYFAAAIVTVSIISLSTLVLVLTIKRRKSAHANK